MSITLEMLAASAVSNVSRGASKAVHTLTVVEARAAAIIKDGNKKPAEDGSKKLTVVLGKHTLPMDCIRVGTSRLAVTADQVEAYTEALQNLINEGKFDEAIEKAQAQSLATFEKIRAKNAAPKVAVAETADLDLDALDDAEEEQVDTDEEL